jgi:hypothetical protein
MPLHSTGTLHFLCAFFSPKSDKQDGFSKVHAWDYWPLSSYSLSAQLQEKQTHSTQLPLPVGGYKMEPQGSSSSFIACFGTERRTHGALPTGFTGH